MDATCALLIVLRTLDGGEVSINPAHVTHLLERIDGAHFTGDARCMINLSNGKFVTVPDQCDVVRNLLKGGNK